MLLLSSFNPSVRSLQRHISEKKIIRLQSIGLKRVENCFVVVFIDSPTEKSNRSDLKRSLIILFHRRHCGARTVVGSLFSSGKTLCY